MINGNGKIHDRDKPVAELHLHSQEISGIHGQEEHAPAPLSSLARGANRKQRAPLPDPDKPVGTVEPGLA